MIEYLIILQVIGLLVGFFAIIIIGTQKESYNQKILMLCLIGVELNIFGYLMELISSSIDAILVAIKISYIGKIFLVFFFFHFMLNYFKVKRPKWLTICSFIIQTFLLAFILTAEHHSLFYTSIELSTEGNISSISLGKGMVYIFYFIVLTCYMLMLVYLCFSRLFSKKVSKKEKKRVFALALTGMIPFFLLICYLIGWTKYYDASSIGMLISCLLLIASVIQYELFDTIEVAKDTIIENTEEGFIVLNEEYQLLYANYAAKTIFPEIKDSIYKNIQGIQNLILNEVQYLEENNNYYEVRYNEIRNKSILKGYLIWIIDITELHNHNKELAYLTKKAEEANHSKSIFLANMSHEIRTPMNAILGMTEIILKNDVSSENKDAIYSIRSAGKTLLTIINDILDLSKIESGKMEIIPMPYELGSVLNDIYNMIAIKLSEDIVSLNLDIKGNIPSILKGDEVRIQQVLINLLNNAAKFTKKGSITLEISFLPNGNKGDLCFRVIDTGKGIKKKDMDNLFKNFQRVDMISNRDIEGSGLGLSICKKLVEQMDGTISVESDYGKGSIFSFSIPQEIIDNTPLKNLYSINGQDEPFQQSFYTPDLKILIVDDNDINLKVARTMFSQYLMVVDTATSGLMALSMAKKKKYDIIFMDHMMPEMDGIETLQHLRRNKRLPNFKTPIIAFTANVVNGMRDKFIEAGFDDYVAKPIEMKKIESVIKSLISAERIIDISSYEKDDQEDFADMVSGKKIIINGINTEKGMKLLGNNQIIYENILKKVMVSAEDKILLIEKYALSEQWDEYITEIHTLKSIATNIGAVSLEKMAHQHELCGHKNDYLFIKNNVIGLLSEYSMIIENIQNYFQNTSK